MEGKQLLDAEQLRAIPAERLLEARLVGVPCLRLLALRYPVHHYFTAVRRHEDPMPPEAADTYLAVTRRRYVVRHYELSPPAYQLLRALLAGQSVGEAIGRAARAAGPDLDRLRRQPADVVPRLGGRGVFPRGGTGVLRAAATLGKSV